MAGANCNHSSNGIGAAPDSTRSSGGRGVGCNPVVADLGGSSFSV